MAYSIKMILNDFFNQQDNWRSNLLNAWPSIIGDLHTQVQIEKIYDDMLIVGVRNSCLMQELHLLSEVFIKAINEKLDQPRVKKIRFKSTHYTQKNKKTTTKHNQIPGNTIELSTKEHDALSKITDSALRTALQLFLIRCHHEQKNI
jgi:hypothetical protein